MFLDIVEVPKKILTGFGRFLKVLKVKCSNRIWEVLRYCGGLCGLLKLHKGLRRYWGPTAFQTRLLDVKYRVITKEMTEIKHVLLSHGVT
jgi:hypothetical protein